MHYEDFMRSVQTAGFPMEKLADYDLIFLPENIDVTDKPDQLFEALGTTDLLKHLKEGGCKCASAFTFGLNIPFLERRASDKWIGCLWIRDYVAVPLLIGTISSLIATEAWTSTHPNEPPPPSPTVHIRLVIGKTPSKFTTLDYDGDGQTLIKVLEGIGHGKPSATTAK